MAEVTRIDPKELWNRLTMVRDGVMMLDGVRHVLMPASILTDLEASGERILGRGLGAILFDAGERSGRFVCRVTKQQAPSVSPPAVLGLIEVGGRARGFGAIDFVSDDVENARFLLRVRDSPHALASEPRRGTACYYPLGFWAGVTAELSGKPVEAEETRCLARGDEYCEFAIRPKS